VASAVTRSEVTIFDAINVKNNVNGNKIVFFADNCVLIKLLRQQNRYCAKYCCLILDTLHYGMTSQKPL